MSYGMRVKDNHGALVMDTNDRIGRLVWKSAITNSSGSQSLPEIAGLKTAQFALITNNDQFPIAHDVYRDGTDIVWTARTAGFGYIGEAPPDCIIFVFSYT